MKRLDGYESKILLKWAVGLGRGIEHIILPDKTATVLDRMTAKGSRSRLIENHSAPIARSRSALAR